MNYKSRAKAREIVGLTKGELHFEGLKPNSFVRVRALLCAFQTTSFMKYRIRGEPFDIDLSVTLFGV